MFHNIRRIYVKEAVQIQQKRHQDMHDSSDDEEDPALLSNEHKHEQIKHYLKFAQFYLPDSDGYFPIDIVGLQLESQQKLATSCIKMLVNS